MDKTEKLIHEKNACVVKKKRCVFIIEKPSNSNGNKLRSYRRGKMLGKGGFAKVFLVEDTKTKELFAMKIVSKKNLSKKQFEKLKSEIKIHCSLKHHSICKFIRFFEDYKQVYILLEYCKNRSVMELIYYFPGRRFSELETKYFMTQVIKAVQYMHSDENMVIHRDLKLGNLFLDEKMRIKIGDFGLAAKLNFSSERKTTICGTPNYVAPEIITRAIDGHSYEVDIWSIGVIFYTLLFGVPPFETKDVRRTYKNIKQSKYSYPSNLDSVVSKDAKNLIDSILQKEPLKRPTLKELLETPFFKNEKNDVRLLPTRMLHYCKNRGKKVPPIGYLGKEKLEQQKIVGKHLKKRTPLQKIDTNVKKNNESMKKLRIVSGLKEAPKKKKTSPKRKNLSVYNTIPKDCPGIWVVKFKNYTKKYGVPYLLNTGIVGFYFNDNTTILYNPTTEKYRYYYKNKKTDRYLKNMYKVGSDYPKELKKKISLTRVFSKFFHENYPDGIPFATKNDDEYDVFVKAYVSFKDSDSFRFNNRSIQVVFSDKTEMVLSQKYVQYKDKKGKRNFIDMKEYKKNPQPSIQRRLNYTKKILTRLLKV